MVGAGTAGCVLAHRLSEGGKYTVLLVEHGGDDRPWIIQMPAGLRSVFKSTSKFNYWFKTPPQPHLNGREVDQPRGKVLGGSSLINGITFLRGNPRDYDDWADVEGCAGWSYTDCLSYFRRLECRDGPANDYRSNTGLVGVKNQGDLSPLNAAFLAADQQAGYPLSDDVNGFRQEGVSRFDMSVEKGMRSSAARSYLHTQRKRSNLHILTGARVQRVLIRNARASAIEFAKGNERTTIEARVEVILSAGVFGTPQILMLSSVGPKAHLEEHGIQVVHNAPTLGENLHDHLEAHIQVETDKPVSLNRHLKPHLMVWSGLQWFGWKGGVAAVSQCHAGAFLRSDDTVTHPNIQFHFFPIFFGENWMPDPSKNGYRQGAGPMRPESRGRIRLASADPAAKALKDEFEAEGNGFIVDSLIRESEEDYLPDINSGRISRYLYYIRV